MTNTMKVARKYNRSFNRKGKGKNNKKVAEKYFKRLMKSGISCWWSAQLALEDEILRKYEHKRACNIIRCFDRLVEEF